MLKYMQNKKRILIALVCILTCAVLMSAQDTEEGLTNSEQFFYGPDVVQGIEAYRTRDWTNALFFLRKAASLPQTASPEIWYLLIMAEMNSQDYYAVLRDAAVFLERFPSSLYLPDISYQVELARFGLGLYDEAIEGFTSFYRRYPDHRLVSSALFWTAEALYQSYEFNRSQVLYEQIVNNYPDSTKYADAEFRIELLKQRKREEKLLYLLRVTGEESVAAKEDYERQLKQLKSEESIVLRRRIQEIEKEQQELQAALEESRRQNSDLDSRLNDLSVLNEQLRFEAEKAGEAQKLYKQSVLDQAAAAEKKSAEQSTAAKQEESPPPEISKTAEQAGADKQGKSPQTGTPKTADSQAGTAEKPFDTDIRRMLAELKKKADRLEQLLISGGK